MRKLLNTLYITTPKSYLSLDGENIVVLIDEQQKFRMPLVNVENIVCFGYMGASPALMGKCAGNNIGLNFIKPSGDFLARIVGKTKGNVIIRKQQYLMSESEELCLSFAKNIVAAKAHNTKMTIQRSMRDNPNIDILYSMNNAVDYINHSINLIYKSTDIDNLRALEGTIAKRYFSIFNNMIIKQKDEFHINGRSKRPPLDYVNCMLSYYYVILSLDITGALETVGVDPYVGFYHTVRAGRSSLSLDIIEEFRAYLVDRTVLSLINTKMINSTHFFTKEGGGILLTDDGRKILLSYWQDKKKDIIHHSILGQKIEKGLLPYAQAQLLARYLRGDIDEYPPYLMK